MTDTPTLYKFNYQHDRVFLVTRDKAWIPMNLLRYITHLRILYTNNNYKSRRMFIKHIIKKGKFSYTHFDVTFGDFGHDPYNHIGRGMKA